MSPLLATSELVSIRLEEVRDWTLVLAPEKCEDPKKTLGATLQGSAGASLELFQRRETLFQHPKITNSA